MGCPPEGKAAQFHQNAVKLGQLLDSKWFPRDIIETVNINVIEGPRTRVGQPEMKYWKLYELHKNEI